MTLSDFLPFVGKPIRIVNHLFDDAYGEIGMYAYIRGVVPSKYNKGDVHDCVEVTLDYAPFRDYNLVREPKVYYQSGIDGYNRPLVTATEAGCYPKDHCEAVFVLMTDSISKWFIEGVPAVDNYEAQLSTLLTYAQAQGLTLAAEAIKELLK